MKKLSNVGGAVAASLILSGGGPAIADGPFCLTFSNHCDTMTLFTVVDSGGITCTLGFWDSTCTGVGETPVLGCETLSLGTAALDSTAAQALVLKNRLNDGLANYASSDGNELLYFFHDVAYTVANGACFPPADPNTIHDSESKAAAAGPFCVTFANSCDKVQLSTLDGGGTTCTVGLWDLKCSGTGLTPVLGCDALTLATAEPTSAQTFVLKNGLNSGLAHLVSSDGRNLTFLFQDEPYSVRNGPCLPPVDLTIRDIEITQGIQNLVNDVPVVQDKTTFLRVYPAVNLRDVANVTMILHGTRDGVPLPNSPLRPMIPKVYVKQSGNNRAILGESFNFWLPPAWRSGTVTLTAEINPGRTIPESDTSNNTISLTRAFASKAPVCTVMIPVRTDKPLYSTRSPGFWQINDRFKSLWPVHDVWVYESSSPVSELQCCKVWPPFFYFGPYELPEDKNKVIASLYARALFTDTPDRCQNANAKTHWVGMVNPDTDTQNQAGFASYITNQSYVKMQMAGTEPFFKPSGGSTFAQELSHNYNGLPYQVGPFPGNHRWLHVNCGSPDGINPEYPYPTDQIDFTGPANHYGFDPVSSEVIEPNEAKDYMSYCHPKWVSDYTWKGILAETGGRGRVSPVTKDFTGLGPTTEILLVAGIIDTSTDAATFEYSDRMSPEVLADDWMEKLAPLQPLLHDDGGFALDLLDPSGGVLFSQRFDVIPHFEGTDRLFAMAIPFHAGAARLRVSRHGHELVEQRISANAPRVDIHSPNGGEVIDQVLTIQWTASDPDNDPLLFTVQYSSDLGAHWQSLVTRSPESQLTVVTSNLPGSKGQALIRVIATDRVNTSIDVSDQPFSLSPHAPVAHIDRPQNGANFEANTQIVVAGGAVDSEDGPLGDAALQWSLDNEPVGAGTEVALSELSAGEHVVTLTAIDSDGQQGTDEITFVVAAEEERP